MIVRWCLVDDSADEAAAFAHNLSLPDQIEITPIRAKQAVEALAGGRLDPDGILMDVDLSNETGMRDTGPGLAQNIRVAQQRLGTPIPSFPIVRFSLRARVQENIGPDSSSDDLFDLKIEKDGLSDPAKAEVVRQKLMGASHVYRAVHEKKDTLALLGLDEEQWELWGHPAFAVALESANKPYLRAGPIMRILVHPGLLVDEDLVAIRLGVEPARSEDWPKLLEALEPCRYAGAASEYFPRWWARGLEDWWFSFAEAAPPLAGCSIAERLGYLSRHFQLAPIEMPRLSFGERPWRTCFLTQEATGELIPVDPSRSVRVYPRDTLPPWLDPFYTALGVAVRQPDDPRIDKRDLARLRARSDRVAS